uniref:Transposase-associated domain-containing protein n=1 Tax=Cajanus cajan TaxID=3821 RepID=A0A151R0E5_CAJCA|nr:hypothetical protein KK1_042971 [Cajanus cajan]
MNARRITDEYQNGVEQFLEFAQRNRAYLNGNFYCPCINYLNGRRHVIDEIRDHLICDGFLTSYTTWIWHGEDKETQTMAQIEQGVVKMEDQIEDMLHDVGQGFFQQAQSHVYDTLKSDSKTPLFPECTTFTRLSVVLRFMNLKAKYGWSDKSFTELLELLKLMLPKDNTLPDRHYEVKKVLCPMGLQYKKIHACPNDCIFYRKEFESLHKFPRCGLSRYKVKDDGHSSDEDVVDKGLPAKMLWYLPIIPRFKRLFANATDAMNVTWHADNGNYDGMLCHPADSPQWKYTLDVSATYSSKELLQAHLYILKNTEEVLPYISKHQALLKKNNPRMNEKSLVNEHNKIFLKWFKENLFSDESASVTLKCLANEPKYNVFTYTGYDINNFSFYTVIVDP